MRENFRVGSVDDDPSFDDPPEPRPFMLDWYALLYDVDRRSLKPIRMYRITMKIIGKMKNVTVEPTNNAVLTLSDP